MPLRPQPRIRCGPDGSVVLRLERAERELLASLCRDLRALLDERPDDPTLRRLSPAAYDDDASEREYRELMADELRSGRQRTLETLERTASADRLDAGEAQAWLTALNDLRLVLGTRLDVDESMSLLDLLPTHPNFRDYGIYAYLSWLQDQLVEALSAGLDDRCG